MPLLSSDLIIIITWHNSKLYFSISLQLRFMFFKIMFIKYIDYKYTFKPLFPSTLLESTNNTRNIEHFTVDGKFIHIRSMWIWLSIFDILTVQRLDSTWYKIEKCTNRNVNTYLIYYAHIGNLYS